MTSLCMIHYLWLLIRGNCSYVPSLTEQRCHKAKISAFCFFASLSQAYATKVLRLPYTTVNIRRRFCCPAHFSEELATLIIASPALPVTNDCFLPPALRSSPWVASSLHQHLRLAHVARQQTPDKGPLRFAHASSWLPSFGSGLPPALPTCSGLSSSGSLAQRNPTRALTLSTVCNPTLPRSSATWHAALEFSAPLKSSPSNFASSLHLFNPASS